MKSSDATLLPENLIAGTSLNSPGTTELTQSRRNRLEAGTDQAAIMADNEKQDLEHRLGTVEAKLRESEERYTGVRRKRRGRHMHRGPRRQLHKRQPRRRTCQRLPPIRSDRPAVWGLRRSGVPAPLLGEMTGLKLSGQQSTVFEVELVTKDGHRVPMELDTRLQFADGKPVGIHGIARDLSERRRMSNELRRRNEALEEANATIRKLMNQDSLTKLANRRSLEETLERAISFARRTAQSLCLVLCDIDHFKTINDTFGHVAGDEVLASFAKLLGNSCRREDTVARFGGEEFVLLLPNTLLDRAVEIAERIRRNMNQLELAGPTTLTASFSVAEYRIDDTSATLIGRADHALYTAKEGGRDMVMLDK